ncbi:MAG: fructokinase [candidate division BRC1 bacterium ADurb.BinA364]|nr:MAG: fructokinase [candidate division BRC1 bacterium ADurb.BinA364]
MGGIGLAAAFLQKTGRSLSAQAIAQEAREGGAEARALFEHFGAVLGGALRWIRDLLDPDRIVLGGSISQSFDLFAPAMLSRAGIQPDLIRVSELGETAPLLGAAALARQSLEKKP